MTWTTPKNFDDAQRLAMAISKSAFCPSGADFPTVLCIIMAGSEIGLQPMAQLAVLVMEGKATQVNTSHYRIAP